MSSVETLIDAEPAQIRALANWMWDSVGPALGTTESSLSSAAALNTDWQGRAGETFRDSLATVADSTDSCASRTRQAAQSIETFAYDIESARQRVDDLRAAASAAGLDLTPTAILAPPAAGPLPVRPPAEAEAFEHTAYQRASARYQDAVAAQAAYDQAAASMAEVRTSLRDAETVLAEAAEALDRLKVEILTFAVDGWVSHVYASGETAIRGRAAQLLRDADLTELRARQALDPLSLYDDLDHAGRLRAQAAGVVDDAGRLARAGKAAGAVVSVAATAVGVGVDIHEGESVGQALASNGAGLVASVGLGAAAGAIVGSVVPGAGTVVGGAVGAVVGGAAGIFTSGVVDGIFENAENAWQNGVDDLCDTGRALWDISPIGMFGRAWDELF